MAEMFPSNLPDSLAGTLNITQENVIGCPEKHDISRIIKTATCYKFRRDEAGASGWLASHPKNMITQIGAILSTIIETSTPVWIESDFDDFIMYSGSHFSEQFVDYLSGFELGFLFFKEEEGILGCVICWSRPGMSENDISNITICPAVMHIDVDRFRLLDKDMKPSFLDNLQTRSYNAINYKALGEDIHKTLSNGISASILMGIVDDASIINGQFDLKNPGSESAILNLKNENFDKWKEAYIKLTASFASRLVFFGIASLGVLILNSSECLRAPGSLYRNRHGLIWKASGTPLDIPDAFLTPYVTGQVTLKTCSTSCFSETD